MHYVQNGWPETKNKLYGPVKKYWNEQGSLSIHKGLIALLMRGKRHLEISVYIENMVCNCVTCEKYCRERVEPFKGRVFPDRPWSKVAADYFQHDGKCYLLVVDYYSWDIEIYKATKSVTSADTILKMKNAFSHHGIPDILISDNGPQFDLAEFRRFADVWGFEHAKSSPLFIPTV